MLNLDRKLAQEEVWIRQGIKARRTCNEGRGSRPESDASRARRAPGSYGQCEDAGGRGFALRQNRFRNGERQLSG